MSDRVAGPRHHAGAVVTAHRGKERREVEVTLCPEGPILVRGADIVYDGDGVPHPVNRPVVAVCRCAKSSRLPWCDGTHKVTRPAIRRSASLVNAESVVPPELSDPTLVASGGDQAEPDHADTEAQVQPVVSVVERHEVC